MPKKRKDDDVKEDFRRIGVFVIRRFLLDGTEVWESMTDHHLYRYIESEGTVDLGHVNMIPHTSSKAKNPSSGWVKAKAVRFNKDGSISYKR